MEKKKGLQFLQKASKMVLMSTPAADCSYSGASNSKTQLLKWRKNTIVNVHRLESLPTSQVDHADKWIDVL